MGQVSESSVQAVLTRRLGLAEPEFHLERAGEKISGSIVSSTFEGKPDGERQRVLWNALEAEYGDESVRLVGMLLAYTPEEWHVDLGV